eukprot:gene13146-14429_t
MGRAGPCWAVLGLHGPLKAFKGRLHGPSWAAVGQEKSR